MPSTYQSKAASFGQNTSQLYERDDGKKPWRAEIPAGPEQKAAGKAGLAEFHKAWPLTRLRLDTNHSEHVARLQAEIETASAGRKGALLHRLQMAEAAAARLEGFKVLHDGSLAIPGCNTFISYVHGLPHGTLIHEPRSHALLTSGCCCTCAVA